jgi:hypothetical protein
MDSQNRFNKAAIESSNKAVILLFLMTIIFVETQANFFSPANKKA